MADHQQATTTGGAPTLSLNLNSNNPFRNRAASPTLASPPARSPASPFEDQPPRPVSRNPFLDPSAKSMASTTAPATQGQGDGPAQKSPTAADLFDALTLDEQKPAGDGGEKVEGPPSRLPPGARPPPNMRRGPPRGENMPSGARRGPSPGHRPTRSQEDALRARRPPPNGRAPGEATSPQRTRPDRRPRRNSESSLADPGKPLTEEEKKAKEARRAERERRHRERKDKKPSNRRMDIIDQLDATSIFGTGLFHHDGPFDALNPHRNRQNSRAAPMQAFPKNSLNNVLGGSGPLNKRPDHATFLGQADEEAFKDFSTGAPQRRDGSKSDIGVFDPTTRGSIIYGDETLGLGASTFLEGTPAARTAIQKSEAETAQETVEGAMQRKKSLAQRIRNINRGPRDYPSGRMTNPEGVYAARKSPLDDSMPGSAQPSERNPFFNEYDTKAEETISVRRVASPTQMGTKSPTSPKRDALALERRATADSTMSPDESSGKAGGSSGGGLLARVKSLNKSRRAPPPRPVDARPTTPKTGRPGTAV